VHRNLYVAEVPRTSATRAVKYHQRDFEGDALWYRQPVQCVTKLVLAWCGRNVGCRHAGLQSSQDAVSDTVEKSITIVDTTWDECIRVILLKEMLTTGRSFRNNEVSESQSISQSISNFITDNVSVGPESCRQLTLSIGEMKWNVMANAGGPTVSPWWRHAVDRCYRGHVHDDVTAQAVFQPADDVVAARHYLHVDLVRVLVGARLARPDVLDDSAALLHRTTVTWETVLAPLCWNDQPQLPNATGWNRVARHYIRLVQYSSEFSVVAYYRLLL